jgi:RNA polymerase sigma-70 factor (ECF subfamily)
MNKLAELSSEVLMELYAANNALAFDILHQRYSGKMFGYLLKKVSNREVAQDLLQVFFQNVHQSRASYNPAYKLEAWFFALAHNLVVSHYRKCASETKMLDSIRFASGEGDKLGGDFGNEEVEWTMIEQALAKLPRDQREAMSLRYVSEESYPAIAQKMDRKEASVRKLVSRGILKLKEILHYEKV